MMGSRVLLVLVLAAACSPALSRRTHTPTVTKDELTTAQVGTGSLLPPRAFRSAEVYWAGLPALQHANDDGRAACRYGQLHPKFLRLVGLVLPATCCG